MLDSLRWAQLKSILAEALQQNSPAARIALVERSCAGDTDLLQEAESLLAEAEVLLREANDDLEACADRAGTAIPREDVSEIGRRVGAYVITSEIGRGGMGAVYLAARADGYFEKQVAIKLLSHGPDTAELERRFRSEREVLARLDHPNIARLLDAGTTDDGIPYIVMEYVDGMPLTRFVAENHLSIPARLELFLKVCAAVEVAHRHSVVHRDLKPNNILVNHEGEAKLLDFGIAKLIGHEANPLELTALGQERLTPISASPEQAQGELVTKSSDIYSLGVLLYELLTGVRPHRFRNRNPSRAELITVLCEQEPTLPSALAHESQTRRVLRGNLDAVLLCALRKEPSKRYPSVTEFADDIRRHLAGDLVLARSAGAGSRILRRTLHKQWAQFSLVAIGVVLLCGGALLLRNVLRPAAKTQALGNTSSSSGAGDALSAPEKSIAVLPFVSLNADNDNGYFLDGVQDNIITDLGKIADLKVIGRSSVAGYRGGAQDARAIGKALGVSYLLEGSAQKSGDRIRLNARLIDARTNAQVWAQRYDKNEGDLFLLESQLAQEIASQLKAALSPKEKAAIERQPTRDMAAYDLYLRARVAFFQYDTSKSIELLEAAVARDPRFALAYALLAEAHVYTYRFLEMPSSKKRLAMAKEAADTASRLAPDLSDSHLAQAQYYYYGLRDFKMAQKELESTLFPDDRARFLDLAALTERRLGRWKDSIRDAEKAVELDPYNPFIASELMESYLAVRRFADARQFADRAIKRLPPKSDVLWYYKAMAFLGEGKLEEARAVLDQRPTRMSEGDMLAVQLAVFAKDFGKASATVTSLPPDSRFFLQGMIHLGQGEEDKAKSSFQSAREYFEKQLVDHPNDPVVLNALSIADAGTGRKEDALREARLAVELVPKSHDAVDGVRWAHALAQISAWVGEGDAALDLLADLVELPCGPTYGELLFDPAWISIRATPRFQEIVARAARPLEYD
ncbi:MAG: eukaryotic-like serine/threonine-protein kinase [Verrucomicrobiota bacterium]|jgi:TolB-like protein/Flp pilus assembly protein TadD